MDSRLAADPVARRILDILTSLENSAGVRAHYRIIDPPPLTNTDENNLHTAARVLSDWIGLRNASFEINIIKSPELPRLIRLEPDSEEFSMELDTDTLATPSTALAAMTRQIARAYLINANISGSSSDPRRIVSILADVAAVFLGMGKLILNAPAAGDQPSPYQPDEAPEDRPLTMEYLAFTHRAVCAMRGLDWNQNIGGLNQQAITALRRWDAYRDTVFSQSLRNVLTATASHRPLLDAVEDNLLALARFDQLHRVMDLAVLQPLMAEMAKYHETCREGMERLSVREQDTYDPCLVYLNQLRRRMDLQRYADMLHSQQDHIVERIRIVTSALSDLNARNLIRLQGIEKHINYTHCPFDGTPVQIHEEGHDSRVKCHTCGYNFLGSPGVPSIPALAPPTVLPEEPGGKKSGSGKRGVKTASAATTESENGTAESAAKRSKVPTITFSVGLALLPLSWIPMIVYFFMTFYQGKPSPLTPLLGTIGKVGSAAGLVLLVTGLILTIARRFKRA